MEQVNEELEKRKANEKAGKISEKEITIIKTEPIILMQEESVDDGRMPCPNPFVNEQLEGWLIGNNTDHDSEEVDHPRDDDEGSEFRTKAQGGIL